MRGNIVAYEGPAGSGKGFHLSKLQQLPNFGGREDVTFIPRPSLPRDLGPQLGAWSSSFLEYQAICAAVMMPERTFYVDRFVLSRWVYKAFEDGGQIDANLEYHVEMSWEQLGTVAVVEAMRRIGRTQVWTRPEATIFVLLPSLERLVANRRKAWAESGRQYPFNPASELKMYREVALRVQDAHIPGLSVHLIEDDAELPIEAIEELALAEV